MNLVDIIAKNAHMFRDETAFVEVRPLTRKRKAVSWGDFYERVIRLANGLIDRGVKRGDKVFIYGRNSIAWLEAYFAVMVPGAWAVPLNFRFVEEDLAYCANIAEPVACFVDEELAGVVDRIRPRLSTVRNFICIGSFQNMEALEDLVETSSPIPRSMALKGEDPCALYFTSGTTGAAKPVLHLHKNLAYCALNEVTNERWEHEDSLLMLPPFYHLAIGHLFGCMLVGGRAVFLTERITPESIFENVSREQTSLVFLLVPWALDILEALDRGELKREAYDLSRWRLMYMGAQPIPSNLVLRWRRYFPEMQFDNIYGLSESGGPGTIHLGIENDPKMGAIGRPGLLWDARIIDSDGENVIHGEVGELIVKGPGIMKEYYKNPELTRQTIRDGWLYTGDLARMDEDGFVYLVDRKKDLVISGGENIYPVEVEEVLRTHAAVHDVAVIGTSDPRLGEIVTAVIEAKRGRILTEEEMRSFCDGHLPRYKRPRRIIFAPVLRNATGKLEKPRMREKYGKATC
jgi:long-chain acyl-CoA synthetase